MKGISILDCTLRDGGYCNNWQFGRDNIIKVLNGLVNANVDVIECGFLTNTVKYDVQRSKYNDLQQVTRLLPPKKTNQRYAVMINYGEYDADLLPVRVSGQIDIIRIAFHKRNLSEAVQFGREIREKGYDVFMQPMVSMNYSDREFLDLIELMNELHPEACYIVDSFGMMKKRDVLHYYQLLERNLETDISIGFHAHNNFQSAYSNAQALLDEMSCHELIIDTSIYGMGRGAGNLNTELFLSELQNDNSVEYRIKPLLQVMDEVINRFYREKPWGYSLPNYLSAFYMIHPNYANYLSEKNTLTIDAIDDIFSKIDKKKAVEFDLEYIERLYNQYMSQGNADCTHMDDLVRHLRDKKILLIAPGKSVKSEGALIMDFIKNNDVVSIGINHIPCECETDYVFVSNMRRFKELPSDRNLKIISTSNIQNMDSYVLLDYSELLNSSKEICDNAGIMAISFLKKIGCREVWLAGYDGYDYKACNNYENKEMALIMDEHTIDALNSEMQKVLRNLSEEIQIHFLTNSRFAI